MLRHNMEKRTYNLGKLAVGLMSLVSGISGCQSTGDKRVRNYWVASDADEYITKYLRQRNELYDNKELDIDEYEHFCEKFSGKDRKLSLDEAKEGLQALAAQIRAIN